MAKTKAVYAPGELEQTRNRLGQLDKDEAKRMAELLGGEVGYERSTEQEASRNEMTGKRNRSNAGGSRVPGRRVELVDNDDSISREEVTAYLKQKAKTKRSGPADDPSVKLKSNYWQRIKMDKYCAQGEFEIKNNTQVFFSMLSILGDPTDYVNPAFVNRKMNIYYKCIENLVTSVRALLPRNNMKRNERFKRASPFAFTIIDTFRYWNIDKIATDLSRIQLRPRSAKTIDFIEIIKNIYRPLYILELLEPETHIKEAFRLLYKVLYLENPADETAKTKNQEYIRTALASYSTIRREIHYQLYPLLMKLVSHCWLPYETFFVERKNRIKAFLGVSERNRISPQMESALSEEEAEQMSQDAEENAKPKTEMSEVFDESTMQEPLTEEDRQKKEEEERKNRARESEKKILERSLFALETLFPKAGWSELHTYPDIFPYFSDVFNLKKVVGLVSPFDPLLHAYVLARILEELFFGMRYVSFGTIVGPDGNYERMSDFLSKTINGWQEITETGFDKEYFGRLNEYCQMLENTAESRTSNFAKRLLNELHWAKRLYFFPYYRFESIMAPPFQKKSITAVFPEVRSLRRHLSVINTAIEQANQRGGAETKAPCDGINNPWDPYVFQVPNPVSKRLDALLPAKKRTNAALISLTLAVTIVLDHLLNDEDSWAYTNKPGFLFRSENNDGVHPISSVSTKIDTELIFKNALKKRQMEASQTAGG